MIKLYHLDPDKDFLGGARNGAKIMIALRDLGIPHEVVYIDRKRDMRDPTSHFCRTVNPWGTVPVLDHDGFLLRESASILRYLADITPGNSVWPTQHKARAVVDQWLTWECAMLVPSLLNVIRLGRYDGVDQTDSIARAQELHEEKLLTTPGMREGEKRWHHNLRILDDNLADKEYAAGHYSIADMALGCVVPIGPLFGMTVMPFKNIHTWLKRLEQRQSWQQERTFLLDMDSGKKAALIPCTDNDRAKLNARQWAAP
jgi:glutathione S-transferase